MCIFLGLKKYGIWGDFSEKFQVLCKNPDEVTRFDGIAGRIREAAMGGGGGQAAICYLKGQ
jgi:hypothetical protein